MDNLLQDLRLALRILRRSPGFTLIAVFSLALGIGANTAIFQLIDAVALRPLPVHDPATLAEIRIVGGNRGLGLTNGAYSQLTRPIWQELQSHSHSHQQAFSDLFAWGVTDVRIGDGPDLQRAQGLTVSGSFFRTLGIQPWRGRLIDSPDETATCPATHVVVSFGYWQRALGGRDLTRDTRLTINGQRHEVIGVTPPGFFGLAVGEHFDVAVPFCQPKTMRRELFDLAVMGRLRPGWSLERATAHLDALSAGLFDATAPTDYEPRTVARFKAFRLAAYPAGSGVSSLRHTYTSSLHLLLVLTALVLLIACANLANLMLARAAARERDVAVRLALGASRLRLVRQFVVESVLLATLGAAAGLWLAQALSRALLHTLATTTHAPTLAMRVDLRLLLFTTALAAATTILFGVIPALRATRVAPAAVMKTGGRGLVSGGTRRGAAGLSMHGVLVVAQIAVSLVLLVAALLFVRSFHNLLAVDAGMRQQQIALAFVGFHREGLAPAAFSDFKRSLVSEIRTIPGVQQAATTTFVPLLGGSWAHGVTVDGKEGASQFTAIGPGYFDTMGTPIVQGRDLADSDTATSPRVAIVNQTFVRTFIGETNPIGRTLRTNPEPGIPGAVYEIVGVLADTRYNDLRTATPPMAFVPDPQYPPLGPWAAIVIHTSIEPSAAIASITRRLAQTHPRVFAEFVPFDARIADTMVRERLLARLAGFFGLLAAMLATIGLYGVLSYAIAQRRQEIGVRIALGAARSQVMAMVLRDASRFVIAGAAIGLALALLAGRLVGSLLFGLTPHDPLTLAAATALLALVAALASAVPARRAATLDPLTALRQD